MEVDRDRIKLMTNQIREMFGKIPENIVDFVTASQICQAEALKYFVESTRYRKWHTSGILWWNLLDGWPQFSDSVVDYYFTKKLAYHYIRRSQVPVCVFLGEPGPGKHFPIIISNDSRYPAKGSFQIWDADTGDRVFDGNYEVPANQNWQFGRIRTFTGERRLYLIKWNQNGDSFGNHYLVGSPPIQFNLYRKWLYTIADLPTPFNITPYTGD
jgi:beta-mannosidase